MVKKKIIAPVTEPTDWLSSIVIVQKMDGILTICLYPKDFNAAVKRPYAMPVIDDITSEIQGAKIFSAFDAKKGFWQI